MARAIAGEAGVPFFRWVSGECVVLQCMHSVGCMCEEKCEGQIAKDEWATELQGGLTERSLCALTKAYCTCMCTVPHISNFSFPVHAHSAVGSEFVEMFAGIAAARVNNL